MWFIGFQANCSNGTAGYACTFGNKVGLVTIKNIVIVNFPKINDYLIVNSIKK